MNKRKPKTKLQPKLCECGCGEYANPGYRFIYNHHKRGKNYWKSQEEPQLCECGCGEYAKPGNKYINGHYNRDEDYWDPEPQSQLCECGCGELAKPGKRFIHGHYNKNRSPSDETRIKQKLTAIKNWEDPERHIKMSCRLLGITRDDWDGFGSVYCELWCEELREHIRDKYNRICFICDKTEEENGQKLDVHHVDYNKDCDCDGTECRLVPLCKSCHGKTTAGDREMWEDLIMDMLENDE